LDEVRIAVPGRELHQAQPIAMRVQPHRFGVDRDRIAEGEAPRNIALV